MYFFFFNDTATTEIYTLSLHDALPIWKTGASSSVGRITAHAAAFQRRSATTAMPASIRAMPGMVKNHDRRRMFCSDRKSTRLNSSHANISYAVFCLKKKKQYHFKYTPQ